MISSYIASGHAYSYFEKDCWKKHATIPKAVVGGFEFTVFKEI